MFPTLYDSRLAVSPLPQFLTHPRSIYHIFHETSPVAPQGRPLFHSRSRLDPPPDPMVSPAWRSLGLVSTLMRNLWTTGWVGEVTQVKQGPCLSQGPGLSEPVNPEPPKGGHGRNDSLWLCTPLRSRLWGSTSCNYPSGGGKLGQLEEVWAARSALAILSVPSRPSLGGGPASELPEGQEGRRVCDGV